MNWLQAFYSIKEQLTPLYGESEAIAIAHLLLGHISGMSKLERLLQKEQMLHDAQNMRLRDATSQLLNRTPIQYVIGEAWFLERRFNVNASVLIPRPETEELVLWVAQDYTGKTPHILDIGTGSGCIPISLKLELPDARLSACDISASALATAAMNARDLNAEVDFFETDILNETDWRELSAYDCIVSNPPYIPETESMSMDKHVTEHEPHLALFVASDDPLLFYRKIGQFGLKHLKTEGCLYFETHKDYLQETCLALEALGYIEISPRKDMHDNWRMIRARRP